VLVVVSTLDGKPNKVIMSAVMESYQVHSPAFEMPNLLQNDYDTILLNQSVDNCSIKGSLLQRIAECIVCRLRGPASVAKPLYTRLVTARSVKFALTNRPGAQITVLEEKAMLQEAAK
jgi:hypothetical protein